jgi:small subunit ribosomal protein S6
MAKNRTESARDIPGRKREYETIFICKPDVSVDEIGAVNGKLRTTIEASGGNLLKVENWGRRKLAYEVKKQLKGVYLFWKYLGNADIVSQVEQHLRLADAVIRYYSVKVTDNVIVDSRPSEVTDESFAKAAVPAADEEAIATGQAPVRPFGDDEEPGFDFEEAVFGTSDKPAWRR